MFIRVQGCLVWRYKDLPYLRMLIIVYFYTLLIYVTCLLKLFCLKGYNFHPGHITRVISVIRHETDLFIVSTFEENGIFMLVVVFLFGHFSPVKKIIFNNNCLYPIEDFDFPSSNFKRYFTIRLFFLKFLGFENCENGHVLD